MMIGMQQYNGDFKTIEFIKPNINDYPGRHLKIKIDKADLDFAEAKDLAKQKARHGLQIANAVESIDSKLHRMG